MHVFMTMGCWLAGERGFFFATCESRSSFSLSLSHTLSAGKKIKQITIKALYNLSNKNQKKATRLKFAIIQIIAQSASSTLCKS
jgi:hypothetical protein